MNIEETRKKASEIFDMWFPIYSKGLEEADREKLFGYFHSGYMAGTKHRESNSGNGMDPGRSDRLIHDDINRDLDL